MAPFPSLSTPDTRGTQLELRGIAREIDQALLDAGREAQRLVVSMAQDELTKAGRVKTGAGRRSIQPGKIVVHGTVMTAEVVAGGGGAPYIAFHDGGTGLYGPRHAKYPILPRFKKALRFMRRGALGAPGGAYLRLSGNLRTSTRRAIASGQLRPYVFAKGVMHPGVKPTHFLSGPAAIVQERYLEQIIVKHLVRALAKW